MPELRATQLSDMVGINPTAMSDEDGFGPSIRPVKYRYILADIRTGALIAMLPMTQVSYSVGLYSGQDMTGTVYVPDMYLDLMVHPPSNDYARLRHPDQGTALGSMFECGNRAIYIMRNDEVVWGGILWTRSYSSGDKTLALSGISWEGYIYYRALRKTVAFLTKTDRYTMWRALLAQVLAMAPPTGNTVIAPTTGTVRSDFGWKGTDGKGANNGAVVAEGGGSPWTGLSTTTASNRLPIDFDEHWPYNSPPIELPPAGMNSEVLGLAKGTIDESWRGYDMKNVGEELQNWAQNNTMVSTVANFEYRVLCWWDESKQRFRQRYTFGEMTYSTPDDFRTTPTGIKSLLVGKNTYATAITADNPLIFDFPGQISEWSLAESMEDAATRVIVTGNPGSDGASKIAAYEATDRLLRPGAADANQGADGWLLYDKVFGYESSSPTDIKNRATTLRNRHWPPTALNIEDVDLPLDADTTTPRTSVRATQLGVTLYVDPTANVPQWGIGDWAAFAIADPFYGGKMFFVRRIIRYTVTVVPDHESDYSHEQISLELTDQTKQDAGS